MGKFPRLYCNANTQCLKLRSVEQWGEVERSNMGSAFRGTSGLVINATDTPILSGVTDMSYMFYQSVHLTGNFSGWDTSKITTMSGMFNGATGFDQDLSSWNVEKVTAGNFANMLNGTQLSLFHYNALLASWSKQNVVASATNFNLAGVQYGGCVANAQAGIEGRARLVSTVAPGKSWAITDGGLAMCAENFAPFITEWTLPSANYSLTLPTTLAGYDFEIAWGDGTTGKYSGTP
jgi:surface protein